MSIYWSSFSYSENARQDLAEGFADYIDLGTGIPTIEYHEVGGAAQGLLATFELSDPSFTVANGVLSLRVSPAVTAVVAPGITAAEPDYYYLKNAEGNVLGEGALNRTAAEQVDTGDILSFTSLNLDFLWSPLVIPNLVAYLTADSVSGVGTTDFRFEDLSSNGLDFFQPVLADQPTFPGGGICTLDGTDSVSMTGGPLTGEIAAWTVAFRVSDTGGATNLEELAHFGHSGAANGKLFSARVEGGGGGNFAVRSIDNLGVSRAAIIANPFLAGRKNIVIAFDSAQASDALRLRVWIDGVLQSPSYSGNWALPCQSVDPSHSSTLFRSPSVNRPWVGAFAWGVFSVGVARESDLVELHKWLKL